MLNNKGFAISTMLYGLLIVIVLIVSLLMSTISFTRKTSKEFNETIVDQLEARKSFNQDSSSIYNVYLLLLVKQMLLVKVIVIPLSLMKLKIVVWKSVIRIPITVIKCVLKDNLAKSIDIC